MFIPISNSLKRKRNFIRGKESSTLRKEISFKIQGLKISQSNFRDENGQIFPRLPLIPKILLSFPDASRDSDLTITSPLSSDRTPLSSDRQESNRSARNRPIGKIDSILGLSFLEFQ